MISATSGAGTQLREDIETGVFDRFKSLPIARTAPLTGILLTDIVRYVMAAIFSLGFLSNAIVSPDTFPAPIRAFAKINPVTHLVNAFNTVTGTGTFGTEAMLALGVSAACAAVIIPITIVVYCRKI